MMVPTTKYGRPFIEKDPSGQGWGRSYGGGWSGGQVVWGKGELKWASPDPGEGSGNQHRAHRHLQVPKCQRKSFKKGLCEEKKRKPDWWRDWQTKGSSQNRTYIWVTLPSLHTEQNVFTFWESLSYFCDQIQNGTKETKQKTLYNFWVESEYVITFCVE